MKLPSIGHIRTRQGFQRFIERRYGGSLDDFYQALNAESTRLISTDLKKSARLTAMTEHLDDFLPDRYRAHLYRIRGRHYHIASDYDVARRWYNKAIALFVRLRDGYNRAKVQKALLDVLMYLGKYEEAKTAGRKAIAYFRRRKLDTDYAQVLTNLGNLFHRLDDHRTALRHYDKALAIFTKLDNAFALALVQFNRANVLSNLNRIDEAEKLYRFAAETYRSLDMELWASQADYSLATIAFLKGEYTRSLTAFTAAADTFRRLGDRRLEALTELDTAEIHLHLNLYSQVIDDAGDVAADFRRLKMNYEQAKALYFSASAYFAYGDFARVTRLATQARRMFAREDNQIWQGMCRFLLARVDRQEGRLADAAATFKALAAFYKQAGDGRRHLDARLAWMETLIAAGQFAPAGRICSDLLARQTHMTGHQLFMLFLLAGEMYAHRDMQTEAAKMYRRAIRQARRLQTTIAPDEMRRFFWMDKIVAFNRLAALYLDRGRYRQAFDVLEAGRAQSLLQITSASTGSRRTNIPPRLEQEQKTLRAYLRKVSLPAGGGSREIERVSGIRRAEQRLWKIEQMRGGGRGSRTAGGSSPTLEQIQKKLKRNDRLIHFACRENIFGTYIVEPSGLEFIHPAIDQAELRGLTARLYFMMTSPESHGEDTSVIDTIIMRISDAVWRPVSDRIGTVDRLVLIPDGFLQRLPLYALREDAGRALFESRAAYIFSSGAAFVANGISGSFGTDFGARTIVAPSIETLPGTGEEARAIARLLPQARLYTGEDASRERLFEGLAEKNGLVHLAAHAAQSYENDLFSQILLADGPVYPFDLLAHTIRAKLVVLSGCQTGDPGLFYKGTTTSIAQTVTFAGAKAVVASYWPVADDITCVFMQRFYHYLGQVPDTYQALSRTMMEIKASSSDFRHWAPFYLLGR